MSAGRVGETQGLSHRNGSIDAQIFNTSCSAQTELAGKSM